MSMRRLPVPDFDRLPVAAAVAHVFDKLLPSAGAVSGATRSTFKSLRAEVIGAGERAAVQPVQFLDLSARF